MSKGPYKILLTPSDFVFPHVPDTLRVSEQWFTSQHIGTGCLSETKWALQGRMSFLSSKLELANVINFEWHSSLQALPYIYDLKYNLPHIKQVFCACVRVCFYVLKGQSNAIAFYVPAWLAVMVVLFHILWRKYTMVINSVCEVSSELRIGRAQKFSFSLYPEVLFIYSDPSIIRTLLIGIPRFVRTI